jgi:PPM family protein phosphatase
LQTEVGARTSVGRVRENNEDAYLILEPLNLFIVSDGMGGEAHGEVASALAVEVIAAQCKAAASTPPEALEGRGDPSLSARTNELAEAVRAANRAVHRVGTEQAANRGMGATVVAAWLDLREPNTQVSVVHVGDSRVYLLHQGKLRQLTVDHSLVAEQVRHGLLTAEQAASSEFQNVLTRALGPREEVKVDASEHPLARGDSIVLATDGLTRMVANGEIADLLNKENSAQAAADQLVALADERGGPDNSTVIVVRLS